MAIVEGVVDPLRLSLDFGLLAELSASSISGGLTHSDTVVELILNRQCLIAPSVVWHNEGRVVCTHVGYVAVASCTELGEAIAGDSV